MPETQPFDPILTLGLLMEHLTTMSDEALEALRPHLTDALEVLDDCRFRLAGDD